MLSGKMPPESFPKKTQCQGSETVFYTQHNPTKYKIFPNIFLTDMNGNKPSTSATGFAQATQSTQSINGGIFVNAPGCKLTLGSTLNVKNWINALYTGRIPLAFYGPPTLFGEQFKMIIENNDLDNRTFAKDQDLSENSSSRDKTTFYQK